MSQPYYVLTSHLFALINRFDKAGMDANVLMESCSLNKGMLSDPFKPHPMHLFGEVEAQCREITGDSLFALHAAIYSDRSEHGWGVYAVVAQPDLRGMLSEAMQHWGKMQLPLRPDLLEANGAGFLTLSLLLPASAEMELYSEYVLGLIYESMTFSVGRPLMIREVYLQHAPRTDAERYEEAFGCPVHFSSGKNALVFDQELLSIRLPRADQRLAHLAGVEVEKQITSHYEGGSVLVSQIRNHLANAETPELWRLDHIADSMQLPARTFQHRLMQEGTSFKLLADEIRRHKAPEYLIQGIIQDDIAYRLGYADVSSFRKAFRRWYSVAPGEWKRGMA